MGMWSMREVCFRAQAVGIRRSKVISPLGSSRSKGTTGGGKLDLALAERTAEFLRRTRDSGSSSDPILRRSDSTIAFSLEIKELRITAPEFKELFVSSLLSNLTVV